MVKRLAVLGSTGSIGQNALRLVDAYPEHLEVVSLAAGRYSRVLHNQCLRHRPIIAAVADSEGARRLRQEVPDLAVVDGVAGLALAVSLEEVDMVLSAITGAAGLAPTYAAVAGGKPVALANKESMVMAGELLMPLSAARNAPIIPVDSEHSALHQCLRGARRQEVKRLILTASGGPLRDRTAEQLAAVRVEEALAHPTWSMGPKITVDSATLMNKGLEVIEAHHFFGLPAERLDVVVHPQSVIHSMVEFVDGSLLAQMSITDMRSSLLYAFAHPERWESRLPDLDLFSLPALAFERPDTNRFPCLRLAYDALRQGGTAPTVLNASNEVAVHLFLQGVLPLTRIPELISRALDEHEAVAVESVEQLLELDRQVRAQVRI